MEKAKPTRKHSPSHVAQDQPISGGSNGDAKRGEFNPNRIRERFLNDNPPIQKWVKNGGDA